MRKLSKNNSGITMIEVLITVAILAIVVVPCLSSFVVAQRGNVLARQTADAYTQASNLMETLKGVKQPVEEQPVEEQPVEEQPVEEQPGGDGEGEISLSPWQEAVLAAMEEFNGITEVVTAFAQAPEGQEYVIVSVYAGDHTVEPEDAIPVLKGVIAP